MEYNPIRRFPPQLVPNLAVKDVFIMGDKEKINHLSSTNLAKDSTWGSLNDSELNIALHEYSTKAIDSKENIAARFCESRIDTDVDDEVQISVSSLKKKSIDDWGSLKDSEFISFVNKLSQSAADSTKNLESEVTCNINSEREIHRDFIEKTGSVQISKIPHQDILSSPVLVAQDHSETDIDTDPDLAEDENGEISELEPTMEEELKDADKYAFETHHDYFAAKNIKQQEQNQELSEFLKKSNGSTHEYPPLFENCKIHVNGRTDPDILQLRKMIVLYGGAYVHYLSSKSSVTHIVAESLPPRKRVQYGNCKVVSPKWIVESISAKKLLNWADYRLEQLGDFGQRPIKFHAKKTVEEEGNEEKHDNNEVFNEKDDADDADDDNAIDLESKGDFLLSQELQKSGVDAKHEDFLRIFFSKSRLHHLSTWKSELRSNFLSKAIEILQKKKKENTTERSTEKYILHVDFDCFFATVSAKSEVPPIDLSSVPCCVTHGGNSADISSCNYVARKYGVKNGMWMSRAKKLCPNIVSLPYQFEEYERVSKLFYEKLLSYDIDSILPVSIDEALVDITTMCKNGDSNVLNILKKIKHELDSITNCTVSCGCGKNVLLAKLALRKAKPNGIFLVPDDESSILNFLDNINVTLLPGFGWKLNKKLEKIIEPVNGEVTLKALRKVEKSTVNATFGLKMGEKLFNYARGLDDTSIDIIAEPEKYLRKSVSIDINWGIRFAADAEVELFLHRLSKELNKRLIDIDMIGSNLTLKLSIRHPDAPIEPAKYLGMGLCTFVSKSARLGVATREVGVLSSELKYLWRYLNVEPKELRGVGVGMTRLAKSEQSSVVIDNQMKLQFKKRENPLKKEIKKSDSNLYAQSPILKPSSSSRKDNTISPHRAAEKLDITDNMIDWDVFSNLPSELQFEIKEELRRRRLQASPKKRRTHERDTDIAILLSPKKKRSQEVKPVEMASLVSPEKIREEREKQLIFQGIHVSDEAKIIEKILYWISYTLDEKQPVSEKDLELFNDFMIKLISTNDLLRFVRIIEAMEVYLECNVCKFGYSSWNLIIENLRELLNQQSYINFEYTF